MSAPSKIRVAIVSERLTNALVDLAALGLRTHCSDPETRHLWLSDHAHDRAQAVKLCKGCPIIRPCGQAASARRETFGVWAAVDRTRSPGKIGRPTTHPVDDVVDTDETTAAA